MTEAVIRTVQNTHKLRHIGKGNTNENKKIGSRVDPVDAIDWLLAFWF
ncbi:hypothetical protein CRENPOLYSF1_410021 [Crenothrix polyspora]|uniref:Uncharacterized protein n=1 Tax=Crenothrix polyspora TaxID=360316 RepID=A0A1R4HAP2_9GAMM|nr:hypothetical protein CRENPOLYSF1_410021 [Crenothrix polyspora]